MTHPLMIGKIGWGAGTLKVGTDDPLRSFYTVQGFLPPRMSAGATWVGMGGGGLAPRDTYGQGGAASAVGQWYEWDFPVRPQWKAGTPSFGMVLNWCPGPNIANFTMHWDGIQYGDEVNGYAATYAFASSYMGMPQNVLDKPYGLHTLRLTITGKHASSTGMYLLVGSVGIWNIPG